MPRPKGSPNIRSKTVGEICKTLNFNPIQELINLRNSTHIVIDKDGNSFEVGISPELKEKICNDLLPYIYPRLTSTQISGPDGGPLTIQIIKFKESDEKD
jgi:hypothetical protein